MKVFVVPDLHFPFHDKKTLEHVLRLIKFEKPDKVIQLGDLLDQYSFSKYTKSLKVEAQKEIADGVRYATHFWENVNRAAPKAGCIQLLGNHDVRVAKRIMEKIPELECLLHKGIYEFKGIDVAKSDRDFVVLDGVYYCHGWLSKSSDHIRYFGGSVVHGHLHKPGISTEGPGLWAMDAGYLADRHSLPLSYTQSKLTKWTMACGVVEDGKPRLILLE